jgi:hypothetical protein
VSGRVVIPRRDLLIQTALSLPAFAFGEWLVVVAGFRQHFRFDEVFSAFWGVLTLALILVSIWGEK